MKSVYVMKSNGAYKIGVSQNPEKRLRNLGIGNCNIELIYTSEKLSNAYVVEGALHKKFSDCKIAGEWFFVEDEDSLLQAVKSSVDTLGVSTPRELKGPEEMLVKEDGEIYTLSDWLAKTKSETEEMACINEELQKLLYTVQGHYVPNIFTDGALE